MQAAGGHLYCEIFPSMELDDVFLQFLKRFDDLPNPRSVAEARITTIEIEALSVWFSQQWGKPRMWCESTFQSHIADETFASPQEMFGAVLIILASEVCRARSDEDSVWPAVTAVLKADAVSFPALFVGGQPTTACKNAVAAGARRLKLRNLIDRYGAQEYFDTLKLQFGFTFRGVLRKLPHWLDGIGLPIAVRILTGLESEYWDLRSDTFTDLWKGLQDFRRNRVSAAYTERLLGCVYFRTTDKPWQTNGLRDTGGRRDAAKGGVMKISPREVKSVRGVGVGFLGQSGDRLSGEFLQAGKS